MTKKTTDEKPEKEVEIKLATGLTHNGNKHVAGEVVTVGESLAARLVDRKQAVSVSRGTAKKQGAAGGSDDGKKSAE